MADIGSPENLIARNTQAGTSMILLWDPVEDEELAGYNIYRSESLHNTAIKINASPLTETQLTDEGLTENQVYYYWVCSENLTGVESDFTGPVICSPSVFQSAYILESVDHGIQYTLDASICNIENNLIEDALVYCREIVIDGLVDDKQGVSDIQAEIDKIKAVICCEEIRLTVEPGRYYVMSRGKMEVCLDTMLLSCGFSIVMRARDPYSYNYSKFEMTDIFDTGSKSFNLRNCGNVPADLKISIQVHGTGLIINPEFQINDNPLSVFRGVVGEGNELVIDGPENCVLINGENRLMDYDGEFPSIPPDSLIELAYYHDQSTTADSVSISIEFRDRWL